MRLERNEGWHARDWCWVFPSQSHEVMDRFALLKRRMALTWLCFNVVVVCSSLRCILSSKISTPQTHLSLSLLLSKHIYISAFRKLLSAHVIHFYVSGINPES